MSQSEMAKNLSTSDWFFIKTEKNEAAIEVKIRMWWIHKEKNMGRGPGIPLEIKQQIARIFDEFGNSKKARREARAFHSRARPGAHQLS